MPTSTPLAAVRILHPSQSQRPLAKDAPEGEVPLDKDPTDPITLTNEFDRAGAVTELQEVLEKAGFIDVEIVPVSLDTLVQVADGLEEEMRQQMALGQDLVVFQLCDGTGNVDVRSRENIQTGEHRVNAVQLTIPFFFLPCLVFSSRCCGPITHRAGWLPWSVNGNRA